MKAIILAAGRGSRMKAMTDIRPKCLIEIRGKPLLDWQLSALQTAGINEIAIVTGYQRESLQGRGITEFYNPRWRKTNMVSSLVCADKWLSSEPCVVTYSDIFYKPQAVISLMQSPEDIAITYDPNWLTLWKRRFVDPLANAETFRLNQDSTLAEIGNKLEALKDAQGQYMGLLKFTPKGWKEILRVRAGLPPNIYDKMHMTGTLQKVIEAKRIQVFAISYRGVWGEVDFAKDLATYQ